MIDITDKTLAIINFGLCSINFMFGYNYKSGFSYGISIFCGFVGIMKVLRFYLG